MIRWKAARGSYDYLYGGAGNDTASYAGSNAGVTVNLATGGASGGDASRDSLYDIENLIGSAHADTLTGSRGDNTLEGGGAGDRITGGAGTDTASYAGSNAGVSVSLITNRGAGGDAAATLWRG